MLVYFTISLHPDFLHKKHRVMIVIVFFVVVLVFALLLNVIDKISSYNNHKDRSLWQDGDSVIVKPKDAKGVGGGFGKRLDSDQHS